MAAVCAPKMSIMPTTVPSKPSSGAAEAKVAKRDKALRRAEADIRAVEAERDALLTDLEKLKILTHRLSDDYLDIDLLDEQVRSVLGYIRADEIVIR